MLAPPTFASLEDYVAHLGDTGLWGPYVIEILRRHDLDDAGKAPGPGFNATYPTFLCGGLVVKLFGHFRSWRQAYAMERAAYALVAKDPTIAAPHLLGEGRLWEDLQTPWAYLITSRMAGVASGQAGLSVEQRLSLAADLGRQVQRLHALPTGGIHTQETWQAANLPAGLAQSSLPSHLVRQAESYVARLGPYDRVFAHGDITAAHVFVAQGRLTGIIDWGDAMVADRHYELIQPYRDLFGCDKVLFGAFLEASDWPVEKDFAQKTLGLALLRQAIGAVQHHSMDVFEPIADLVPLQDIMTLDELAIELFTV